MSAVHAVAWLAHMPPLASAVIRQLSHMPESKLAPLGSHTPPPVGGHALLMQATSVVKSFWLLLAVAVAPQAVWQYVSPSVQVARQVAAPLQPVVEQVP